MIKSIFAFNIKKYVIRRNFIFFLIFLVFLIVFSIDGIKDYKDSIKNTSNLQEIEKSIISKFINYTQYGNRGVKIFFIPHPFSVLFNDLSVFKGVFVIVDSGDGLYIYNGFNGKELFSESSGFMDFSGIFYIVSCLIALLFGFETTRNKELINLLVNISGKWKITLATVFVKTILFILTLLLLLFLSFLWFLINGINLFSINSIWFFLPIVLMVTLFILLGAISGSIGNKTIKITSLFFFAFLLIFVIPWLIQKMFYIEASNNIPTIQEFQLKKLKLFRDFEKRCYNRFGKWKSKGIAPDEIKEIVKSGQENEYKKLKNLELERIEMISKRINKYELISSFFPTSFFKSTGKELSSKGYKNFIDLYKYSLKMKFEFIDFYIDRKLYKIFPKAGIENFIKGKEDLFMAKSRLPDYYWLGILIGLLYNIILFFILGKIYSKREQNEAIKKPEIEFEENNLFVFCENDRVKENIFSYYQNTPAICITSFQIEQVNDSVKPLTFLKYLCRLSGTDENKVKDYLSLINADLKGELCPGLIHKIYFCVKCSRKSEMYVINDFFKNKPMKFEKDFTPLLERLDKKVLYLSTEPYILLNGFNNQASKVGVKGYKISLLPEFSKIMFK